MQLQEIKNEYITSNGTKIEIIPIGGGSDILYQSLNERLGVNAVYYLSGVKWISRASGRLNNHIYGLSRKDFVLFNAYDVLREGWEMIGYGNNIDHAEEGYEYSYLNTLATEFTESDKLKFFDDVIYARRKKEVKEPELIVEVGKQYIRRDGRIYEPVEHNTDVDKISMDYIFKTKDPVHGDYVTYTKNGKFFESGAISKSDLIEEYVPSTNNASTTTVNINGFDVPLPAMTCLPIGTNYCIPNFGGGGSKTHHYVWNGDYIDDGNPKNGIIHLSEDAALQHREAVLSFTKLTK